MSGYTTTKTEGSFVDFWDPSPDILTFALLIAFFQNMLALGWVLNRLLSGSPDKSRSTSQLPTAEPSQASLCLHSGRNMDRSPHNPGPRRIRTRKQPPSFLFSTLGLLPLVSMDTEAQAPICLSEGSHPGGPVSQPTHGSLSYPQVLWDWGAAMLPSLSHQWGAVADHRATSVLPKTPLFNWWTMYMRLWLKIRGIID